MTSVKPQKLIRSTRPHKCSMCGKWFIDRLSWKTDLDVVRYVRSTNLWSYNDREFDLCPRCIREIKLYVNGGLHVTTYR